MDDKEPDQEKESKYGGQMEMDDDNGPDQENVWGNEGGMDVDEEFKDDQKSNDVQGDDDVGDALYIIGNDDVYVDGAELYIVGKRLAEDKSVWDIYDAKEDGSRLRMSNVDIKGIKMWSEKDKDMYGNKIPEHRVRWTANEAYGHYPPDRYLIPPYCRIHDPFIKMYPGGKESDDIPEDIFMQLFPDFQ